MSDQSIGNHESWESFDVVRFDLGTFLQGQTMIAKLKSAYNSIIKMLFIFKTMLLVLLLWIHLTSGHRCILGVVLCCINGSANTFCTFIKLYSHANMTFVGHIYETLNFILVCNSEFYSLHISFILLVSN